MCADNTTTTTNALGYPLLQPSHPVPSDIEVSQQIVQDVGLLPLSELAQQ
jgi:formate--tetrahydrofolate ligase